jgi:hypothetical protein
MHGVWTAGEKKVNAELEHSRGDFCLLVSPPTLKSASAAFLEG